jgi:hypothetical protein
VTALPLHHTVLVSRRPERSVGFNELNELLSEDVDAPLNSCMRTLAEVRPVAPKWGNGSRERPSKRNKCDGSEPETSTSCNRPLQDAG